ncbi:MAG: caspase family protein [Pirellulaceae bacterium]
MNIARTPSLAACAISAAILCLSSRLSADDASAVPADTCILEINTLPNARLIVDGKDYGSKRELTYRRLKPKTRYRINVQVNFPGTTSKPWYAYIVGGHRIVLAVMPESATNPEVVLQTGHQSEITAMAVSNDGRLIVTGGEDHNVILWDAVTGAQIRTLHRLKMGVTSVDISPDGELVAGASYGQVNIWETRTGEHVQTIEYVNEYKLGTRDYSSLKFDPDSRHIVIGGGIPEYRRGAGDAPGFVALWNANTGKVVREYRGAGARVTSIDISADGRSIAAGADDGSTYLWNKSNSGIQRQVRNHRKRVAAIAFSPDKSKLASIGLDDQYIVADGKTGEISFAGDLDSAGECIDWRKDGKRVLVSAGSQIVSADVVTKAFTSFDQSLVGDEVIARFMPAGDEICVVGESMAVFDAGFSKRVTEFARHPTAPINHFAVAPGAKELLANYGDHTIATWDTGQGRLSRKVSVPGKVLAISPDCRLALMEADEGAGIWDIGLEQEIQRVPAKAKNIWSNRPAFGPYGKILATPLEDGVVKTWNVETGKLMATLRHPDNFGSVGIAISPTGRLIAVSAGKKLSISDPRTGRRVRDITKKKSFLRDDGTSVDVEMNESGSLAFSPTGNRILVTISMAQMEYDLNTGRRLWQNANGLYRASYSPEGDVILGGRHDGGLFMRYSKSAAHMGAYTHSQAITGVAVAPRANLDISASEDGTIGLWDTATGGFVGRIMLFDEGKEWAVVGATGLFDGSPGGRKLVRFRLGNQMQVVSADRFFQDFYYPGLLAAYFRGERPIPDRAIGEKLAPRVAILEPGADASELNTTSSTIRLKIAVTDRGGGIKRPWIVHNGARLLAPTAESKQDGKTLLQSVAVSLVEGENTIEVFSASEDGSWESEPARITVNYRQAVADSQLYAICVGVSKYAQPAMNLQFAAKDAESLGGLFRERAAALYGKDNVHIAELTDSRGTRESIEHAFKLAAERARPQDTLVVFLAGHGAMVGQRYYFIPHDFHAKQEKVEDDIRDQGIPGDVVDELVSSVPALKRVIIYDTCQSGGALALGYRTRSGFAFRGALERMARASGSFMIAATSASEEATEIDDLGHGVLTYALLAGAGAVDVGPLKTQRLKSDGDLVEVRDWFNYAQDKVPLVTKTFLGQEQFVTSSGSGTSFPLLPLAKEVAE